MVNETDFFELYRKLEFSPDGDVLELKRAYRRRVSLLHPDRRANGPLDVRAAQILQRLTAQYAAAMEFHRVHGRLPGAVLSSKSMSSSSPAHRTTAVHAQWRRRRYPVSDNKSQSSRFRWLILLAALVLGFLLWNVYADQSIVAASAATGESEDAG